MGRKSAVFAPFNSNYYVVMIVNVSSFTHQGSRRRNEDASLVDKAMGLFAVADGIGGGYHGDVASRMAVDTLRQARGAGVSLRKCFELAQEAILRFSKDTLGEALVGTTLTAMEVTGQGISICHIGDSRCYHFTGRILRQLTEDHESFEESMQNCVLSDYLGMPDHMVPLRIQCESIKFSGVQHFLLCTDGLHRQLTDQEIAVAIERVGLNSEGMAERLCTVAAQKEGSDNVTALFFRIEF